MRILVGLLSLLLNGAIVAFVAFLLIVSSGEVPLDDLLPEQAAAPRSAVTVRPADTPGTVVVQLFEWRWDDVAVECETSLAPMGVAAVRVSPPNEHRLVADHPWWQRYQPVSDALRSRSGGAEDFAEMVRRCAAVGVAIIADAVINHMTGPPLADDPAWGIGSAGSRYDYYDYPGLLAEDFHAPRCDFNGNYGDRAALQRCNLLGRADLDTEADRVQDRIGRYLNRLRALGVAGFHIDAAMHMAAGDIAGILARVDGLPAVHQAVVELPGGAVRGSEYLGNGAVTEHDVARRLAAAFRGGDIASLRTIAPGADGLLPGERAVVFVDSHESERGLVPGNGDGTAPLTRGDGALYDLAHVFMLAWPYGIPQVLSGYAFAAADAGPPAAEDGTTLPVHGPDGLGCGVGWTCAHRRPAVAGMVGFRNHTEGAEVTDWWSGDDGGRIAFGRGGRGFVVINNSDDPMRQWLRTGLPAGVYCNALASRLVDGACARWPDQDPDPDVAVADGTGEAGSEGAGTPLMLTVRDDGSTTAELPPRAAVAIHVGLRPAAEP
jgi:alpha-amylase